ncbi:HsdM family class I SAM-dependent methyltransferase [Geomonas propionica]|uniref:site-specific DNA-methyltransferase (adenine-specific) n=1 Tax=Geomonas propionica TaxID=2798582 RepID=A0ABS0YM05_9BACT|nr:N-6 DNA methylase [Geomonas propionica]MBJ6798547.1 N-6 DNA methylase [Geomonas propionica]
MDKASKTAFARHIRNLVSLMEGNTYSPAEMVGTVLDTWCSQKFPGLTPANLPSKAALQKVPCLASFITALTEQSFLEAAYWLSSAYAILVGKKYRKSLAMFFTPPSITERILSDLELEGVQFSTGNFFDPACGGAAFLAPIALRMKAALKAEKHTPDRILQHVESNLFGADLDVTLCAMSHQFLKMALHEEIIKAQREPTFKITTCDSLRDMEHLHGAIDVLVCNPPYRKVTPNESITYRSHFEEVMQSQPNMYGLFIALSVRLLKPNGVCALVTPTSFLSGQYFSKLRVFLVKEARILRIGMVSDRSGVFFDVEQETALTILRRALAPFATELKPSVSVVSRDGKYVDVGQCILPKSGAVWPIPRVVDDVSLLENAAVLPFRIKDYGYRVRIGSFVWNRDTRPVFMSAADTHGSSTAVPLLWSSDIKKGGNLIFDGHEKNNEEPCFVDFGARTHASVIRRPSVLIQRVTSNDQPHRLVAAAVPHFIFEKYGGFVGENHTVILEQVAEEPVLSPKEMADLLTADIVDRFFRCISGATNVSAFELSQLSLPNPTLLKKMISKGHDVQEALHIAVIGKTQVAPKS